MSAVGSVVAVNVADLTAVSVRVAADAFAVGRKGSCEYCLNVSVPTFLPSTFFCCRHWQISNHQFLC